MASNVRTPPRFVPTLTTVIDSDGESRAAEPVVTPAPTAIAPAVDAKATGVAALSELEAFSIEEELLHRVLQRVDLSLEEKLSDAVSLAVQVQLDEMVPRLRSEIERVLRKLVVDALARELSESTGSAPISGG